TLPGLHHSSETPPPTPHIPDSPPDTPVPEIPATNSAASSAPPDPPATTRSPAACLAADTLFVPVCCKFSCQKLQWCPRRDQPSSPTRAPLLHSLSPGRKQSAPPHASAKQSPP